MTRINEAIATPYGPLSREITELVRETQPELLCPQRRAPCCGRRLATALAALIGAATITLLASGHAFAGPIDPAAGLAQEHNACTVVLDLGPSGVPYQHDIECPRSFVDLGQAPSDDQQIYC
jgi:hypothetical protein